jgi:CubicO group peptidase (beta-lactamase class C family)
LIDAGRLRLEQRVHELYPEWRKGKKSDITLWHLLTHTSGLEEGASARDIYAQKSFVNHTLRAKLVFEPGTRYTYSNRGANLVSGIIGKAAAMRTDRYVAETLFDALGIRHYSWARDRAGQPQGLAGLHLLPRDVAKIGELVLAGGTWNGRQIVSREWLERSLTPGPVQPPNKRLGLFWWLIPEWTRAFVDDAIVSGWRDAGADEAFIAKVKPLIGRRFESISSFVAALRALFDDAALAEWNDNTWKRGVPDARFEFGPLVGAYAAGTLGQYLVVLPRDRLVAVRMRRAPAKASERDDPAKTFPDFVERVQRLVRDAH